MAPFLATAHGPARSGTVSGIRLERREAIPNPLHGLDRVEVTEGQRPAGMVLSTGLCRRRQEPVPSVEQCLTARSVERSLQDFS